MPPRSPKPRHRRCAACGAVIVRRYPSDLPESCSRRCEGQLKAERAAERRLGRWRAKFGPLSDRERQLMAYAFYNGYWLRANRERRKGQAA